MMVVLQSETSIVADIGYFVGSKYSQLEIKPV